ncbi:tyrosine-type recombinase/integrase [Capillimicrobium parvum]|uniref:tyrosine-type recombinase/integrase n=1 Tax=Capillimicrobium parvum TaxID=2884022 RepID=UPI00216B0397|nr:tyrosine-type recombinase/integrase [Capillimicrobium parvum]
MDGRLVKRKVGPVRTAGTSDGLTRVQAERRLRQLTQATKVAASHERLSIAVAAEAYLTHLDEVLGRKPTTLQDYRSILRRHVIPFYGDVKLDRLNAAQVAGYLASRRRAGLAPKTVVNHANFLHGLFGFAVRRGWMPSNPVEALDKPRAPDRGGEVRFLSADQLDRLISHVRATKFAEVDRAILVTAAQSGLRQGELLALRWRDVDLEARVLRVRESFTRGRFSSPKSRHSTRAVPVSARVALALSRLAQVSAFTAPEDLVFAHPELGSVLDSSALRKRFTAALKAAGLPHMRFHDLRHTYGTAMAAAGTPMRMLQEWMGHESYQTTLIYAAYAPDASHGLKFVERAFGRSADSGEEL